MRSSLTSWRIAAKRITTLIVVALAVTQCDVQPTEEPGSILSRRARHLPGAITDLAVIANTDSSVTFRFTEVDDGYGQLPQYDFRFAEPTLTWDGNSYRVADGTCSSPIDGLSVGSSRTCVATGLTPSTNYEFQMRAFRGPWGPTMIVGPLSAIVAIRTLSLAATVASVEVSPTAAAVTVGQTVQLTVVAKDGGGTEIPGQTIAWSSGDTAIAQVSASGLVTARHIGSVTVTAASGGIQGQAQLTVAAGDPPAITDLTAIAITDTSVTFRFTEVDDGYGQLATFDFRFGPPPFSWDGPNTSRVIDGTCRSPINGVAVGVSRTCVALGLTPSTNYAFQMRAFRGPWGPTMVVGPLTSIIAIRTADLDASVSSVVLSPATSTVVIGQTVQLTAVARDAGGNAVPGQTFAWSSGDTSIAQVSNAGLVVSLKAGSATITAATGGHQGQAQVSVVPLPVPGIVSNLVASAATQGSVDLTFTEVTDGTGMPAMYEIRYASLPIIWATASIVSAGTCAAPVAGTSIGALRTCTVQGLTASTSYQFQLVPFRGTPGVNAVFGALSNVAAAATTALPPPPPPPPGGVLFASDWSTATGQSNIALRDGGKWTETRNNIVDLSVVSATGLGFPAAMTNVLRHTFQAGTAGQRSSFVALLNGLPTPAVGSTLYIRYYYRADYLNEGKAGQDNSHHNFEGDNAGGVKSILLMHPGNNLDGTYPVRQTIYQAAYPNNYLQPNSTSQNLTKGVVYRWEIAITLVDANYLSVKFRLYGADDSTLLYPDGATGYTKMVNVSGVNITALPSTTFPYTATTASWLRSWELGNNGGSLGPFSTESYDYFGGICFRNDTWCGPYQPGQ